MPPGRRRSREADNIDEQLTQGDVIALDPPLETTLNTLLVASIKPGEPPVWIDISSKIYCTLKIWFSPRALEVHYFSLLKRCEAEKRPKSDDTARSVAERGARSVAKILKQKFEGLKVEQNPAGTTTMSAATTSSTIAVKKEEAQTTIPPPPTSLTAALKQVKLEVKQERKDNNSNNNHPDTDSSMPHCHDLNSLWNLPLPVDMLMEFIALAERIDALNGNVFALNPAPNITVYQYGMPVGKQYRDAVFKPTSIHAAREKVRSGVSKTVAHIYEDFSHMAANCVVFNLPGGYFPSLARGMLLQLVSLWADFVAKLEFHVQ